MASAARLIDVRNAAASAINVAWAPSAPDQVSAANELPMTADGEGDNELLVNGRQVWVFGDGYRRVEPASRGQYLNEYTLRIVIAARNIEAGAYDLNDSDAMLNFVAQYVVDLLDYSIDNAEGGLCPEGLLLGQLYTESIDVPVACDPILLAQNKLFFSEVVIAFREVA